MRVEIFHNPRCSKSRQTLELLSNNDIEPEIVEYLKTPPTKEKLVDILNMLNLEPRELMRTKEKEYKEQGLDSQDSLATAYVPLDPSYPPARIDFMIADSAPRLIVASREQVPGVETTEAEGTDESS